MDVTIASGGTITDAIDLKDNRLAYIQMPSAWTAANLTFQVSDDGVTYTDLYDDSGSEYVVQATTSRALRLTFINWLSIRFLKIRSGTSATPVAQGAARTLRLGMVSIR